VQKNQNRVKLAHHAAVESYLFCSLTVVRLVILMRAALLVGGKVQSGCGPVACRL
jgi:hypothetical protein